MNQIPIYQHPFVDVFKATKVTEWGQYSQKEGDVTEVYDKQLAKNVIKVSGVTPASNYFQIPAQAHLPKKPLGLIGKYVRQIYSYFFRSMRLSWCQLGRPSCCISTISLATHASSDCRSRTSSRISRYDRPNRNMCVELEWELAADPGLRRRPLQHLDGPLPERPPDPREQPALPPRPEGELLHALSPGHLERADPRHIHIRHTLHGADTPQGDGAEDPQRVGLVCSVLVV